MFCRVSFPMFPKDGHYRPFDFFLSTKFKPLYTPDFLPHFSHWRWQNQKRPSYSIASSILTISKFDYWVLSWFLIPAKLWGVCQIFGLKISRCPTTLQGIRIKTKLMDQICLSLKSMIQCCKTTYEKNVVKNRGWTKVWIWWTKKIISSERQELLRGRSQLWHATWPGAQAFTQLERETGRWTRIKQDS